MVDVIDEDTGMMKEMVEEFDKVGQWKDAMREVVEVVEDKLHIKGPAFDKYNKDFLIDTVLVTLTDVDSKDKLKKLVNTMEHLVKHNPEKVDGIDMWKEMFDGYHDIWNIQQCA